MHNAHLELLGMPVIDRVTGFAGVVTSISFDLYGCIQATVHPGLDKDGKICDQNWFDVNRLRPDPNNVRVMPVPNYESQNIAAGEKGPAEKPRFCKA